MNVRSIGLAAVGVCALLAALFAVALPTGETQGQPEPSQPEITWDEIGDATYPNPLPEDGTADLTDGTWGPPSVAGANGEKLSVTLADIRAFGDLDGDGLDDAAVVLVARPGDGSASYYLAAVRNDGGDTEPVATIPLGENVTVRSLSIEDGRIRVLMGARADSEPDCCPGQETVRTYTLDGSEMVVASEEEVPFEPPSAAEVAFDPERIELGPGENPVSVDGSVDFDGIDDYVLHAETGRRLAVEVETERPVLALSIYGLEDGEVLVSIGEETASFSGAVPTTQDYAIRVVPLGGGEASYTLTVRKPQQQPRILEDFAHESYVPNVVREGPLPTPTPTPTPTATPTPVPTPTPTPTPTGPVIYLTFDDGPNPPYTGQILDILDAYGAQATFFDLGQEVNVYPGLVTAEANRGNTIGNHTYHHYSLDQVGRQLFFEEVRSTQRLIEQNAGPAAVTRCLRPPYGAMDSYTRAWAAELGFTIVLWTVDPRDWARPGAGVIVSRVLANASPGDIVLMHDGGGNRSQTVAALDDILAELSARGYRFEPIRC